MDPLRLLVTEVIQVLDSGPQQIQALQDVLPFDVDSGKFIVWQLGVRISDHKVIVISRENPIQYQPKFLVLQLVLDAGIRFTEAVGQGYHELIHIGQLDVLDFRICAGVFIAHHLGGDLLLTAAVLRQNAVDADVVPQIRQRYGVGKLQSLQRSLQHIGSSDLVQIQFSPVRRSQVLDWGAGNDSSFRIAPHHVVPQCHHGGDRKGRFGKLIHQQWHAESYGKAQQHHPGKDAKLQLHIVEDADQIDLHLTVVMGLVDDYLDLGVPGRGRDQAFPPLFVLIIQRITSNPAPFGRSGIGLDIVF